MRFHHYVKLLFDKIFFDLQCYAIYGRISFSFIPICVIFVFKVSCFVSKVII